MAQAQGPVHTLNTPLLGHCLKLYKVRRSISCSIICICVLRSALKLCCLYLKIIV